MEQVFFRLHVRLIRFVSPLLSPRSRKLLEKIVFLNAFLSLFLLIWLHTTYVNYPQTAQNNCLFQELVNKNMTGKLTDFDVIKVHISNDWLQQLDQGLGKVGLKNHCGLNEDSLSYCNDGENRGITDRTSTSEKLPLLFDSFISSMGMHIHDSQHSAPRYETNGRGGGSARMFSVAERLLSGPAQSAAATASNVELAGEESSDIKDIEVPAFVGMDTGSTDQADPSIGDVTVRAKIASSTTPTLEMKNILLDLFVSQRVYLFSLEKGYLMLHPDERDRHDIHRLDVAIARDSACFGPPSTAWLVHSFFGYDTVVMNWAISSFGGRGFLYNVYSKELFNLNFAADTFDKSTSTSTSIPQKSSGAGNIPKKSLHWLEYLTQRTRGGRLVRFSLAGVRRFLSFKAGVIFSTLFLFFTTTTLVSFTLRETQERMLKFTFLLQHHVSHRIPYASLVFTHVVESLVFVPIMVGMLFFLFEFFSDQLLAFMVLSVVWLSEIFSVICLRAFPSIRFFPRAFFFYFCLFHIYFFSFPFGFSYLALFTTVLFIQHSMVFCWNTFEIPALESGLITALTPRVGMGSVVRDTRVDENVQTALLTVNSEESRISVQGPLSVDRQNSPDPQSVPLTPQPLTVEVPSEGPSGAGSALHSNRRAGSISEPDLDHETQLRESYCRHVELSRRIQQEQLSAMLGIHMPVPTNNSSLASHSNSFPPSPHRSRSSSMYNSTPARSPYQQVEDRGLTPRAPLTDVALNLNGEQSILSYPLSVMASISDTFRWMGLPIGVSTDREYVQREQDRERGRSAGDDVPASVSLGYSNLDSPQGMLNSQEELTEVSDFGNVIRSRVSSSRTLSHPLSPVVTPARRRFIRSGSSCSRGEGSDSMDRTATRHSPVHEKSPFRSTLRSSSSSSSKNNLSGSYDLSDNDAVSRNADYRSRSKDGIGRSSGECIPGNNGALNNGEMTPDFSRQNSGKKIQSGPSKYQHNELMMYNSDIEVAEELLTLGAARVGGVPASQSLFSFARPLETPATESGNSDTPSKKLKSKKAKVSDSVNGYFLHNPYDTNSGSSASRSTQGSGENLEGRETVVPSIEACSASSSAHHVHTSKIAGHGKSDPISSVTGASSLRFPILHGLDDAPDKSTPSREKIIDGPDTMLSDTLDLTSVKSADDSECRHVTRGEESRKQIGPRKYRSLLSSKERGGSSSLGSITSSNDWMSVNSAPVNTHIPNASGVAPSNAANVISPARRVPSVNDFGYRRNDFNMFGNDFNEED